MNTPANTNGSNQKPNLKHSFALPALLASTILALSACAGSSAGSGATASAGATSVTVTNAAAVSHSPFAAAVASPNRSDADRTADIHRKPEQTLAFIGIKPGMVALDMSTFGGYTAELLALAVGPTGRVYAQNTPPRDANSPPQQAAAPEGASAPANPAATTVAAPTAKPLTPGQILAARVQNPVFANTLIPVSRPLEDPAPPEVANGRLDLVTFMFNYHDMGHWGNNRVAVNNAVFKALKPGGIYVIADHAGRPGTGISESGTLHRIEESFLIQEVQTAGFRLVDEGYFMRNPSDPRDKNTPVPAQPKDEFILKFVKP